MPSKNSLKIYVADGYYHVYNRGINHSPVFLDEQDSSVFLSYLKECLTPKDETVLRKVLDNPDISYTERYKASRSLLLQRYNEEIQLIAYCLMPNHFHFLVRQKATKAINRFMSSITSRYAMYFNRKYKRSGPLFEGVYRAVLLENEAHYWHITRYIHKQALAASPDQTNFPSSYPEYLGLRNTSWVHPEDVLALFSGANPRKSYSDFMSESDPLSDKVYGTIK
jgi:putative transposase